MQLLVDAAWPLLVLLFVIWFRKDVRGILRAIRRAQFAGMEFEIEEWHHAEESSEEEIMRSRALERMLERFLARSPHSFDHIRAETGLELSDDDFRDFIRSHRNKFRPSTIVKRNWLGNRVPGGRPGIALIAND